MAARLERYFQSPPDYCYVVHGTHAELDTIDALTTGMWSVIIGPRYIAFDVAGQVILETKYTFCDPNEAMRFRLSV